jgi:hypothetical protein
MNTNWKLIKFTSINKIKLENLDVNIIVQFELETSLNQKCQKIMNDYVYKFKKSLVVVSKHLKTNKKNLFSIVPTVQEAIDVITLEEIEREINS